MAISDHSLTDAEALVPTSAEFRGLRYPYGQWTPEPGTLKEVAPGVFWLRMPLPFSLNHINLYILDEGDGWTLVDTGLNTPEVKALWQALLAGPLASKPVKHVLVTHYHPDHLGLAGWLCQQQGVPLLMARTEFLLAHYLCLDVRPEPPAEVITFYTRAGWDGPALERLKARGWGMFSKAVSPLPASFNRLQDGDRLTLNGNIWEVFVGRGHAPEHLCLYSPKLGVLIAGDQLLPRITSNVSVYPIEPENNPLQDWLSSLEQIKQLDDTLLVLPAHNEPFYNLRLRCDQLAADHYEKLERLAAFCITPKTAVDAFEVLFKRSVGPDEMMMATGESLAHLHYLEANKRLERTSKHGVDYFLAK
jgi:glyoxylase-like metal-dependent hydrolase (beta-lactamase superfamily II)